LSWLISIGKLKELFLLTLIRPRVRAARSASAIVASAPTASITTSVPRPPVAARGGPDRADLFARVIPHRYRAGTQGRGPLTAVLDRVDTEDLSGPLAIAD
jgi:hypothetical protein